MKIVLATPLFPPDIAEPGPYVKELAKRLSSEHAVTIVAYGVLPEHVPNVHIRAISKKSLLPIRLIRFTLALFLAARKADVIIAENGPSVEIALILTHLFTRTKILFHIGDTRARKKADAHYFKRNLQKLCSKIATPFEGTPEQKPELFPFRAHPKEALASYESSWEKHLQKLNTHIHA